MTRSLNKVMLIGNLARDPSLRTTTTGSSVCNFTVVTNREYTDSKGEKQEIPEFHNIVAWANLAEISAKLLKQGDRVYVEGRLQTRKYADKEGVDKYSTEIIINEMLLLPRGVKPEGGDSFEDDVASAIL